MMYNVNGGVLCVCGMVKFIGLIIKLFVINYVLIVLIDMILNGDE